MVGTLPAAAVTARGRTLALCVLVLIASCGGGGNGPPPAGNPPANPVRGVNAPFDPPGFSGPYAVGTRSFHWTDVGRDEIIASDDRR